MGTGTAGSSGGSAQAGAGGFSSGNPSILAFGVNVTHITEHESVTFSAIVTDPDGIDDLIGGNLTSGDGSVTYATFASEAQEGAYSVSLSWSQIQQVDPIWFWHGEDPTIQFNATFYDQAGLSASRPIGITLTCGGLDACDGVCTDPRVDMCGESCETVGFVGGSLACSSPCTGYDTIGCWYCGNGVLEGEEECDDQDFGTSTCTEFTNTAGWEFTGGALTCTSQCLISTESCTYCAGTKIGDEACSTCELGDVQISNSQVGNLPNLTCIGGSLLLRDNVFTNAGIPVTDLDFLSGLVWVGGSLGISNNDESVTDLAGLHGLELGGSGLGITNNALLCQDQVAALRAALMANGWVGSTTSYGNTGACP